MVLHVFNPWHDEALAAATPYYTPTAAARQIAMSLASLPKYWAKAGDVVLLPQGNLVEQLGADGAWHEVQLDARLWADIRRIDPWGWDACLVHQLRRRGAPDRLLPSEDELAKIRRLSSRRTAVELLPRVRADVDELLEKQASEQVVGRSAWCTTLDEAERAIIDYGGAAYVKAPWSCSGRGVFVVKSPLTPTARARIEATIKKQGAVEVEPAYERVQDFAMEFTVRAKGNTVRRGEPQDFKESATLEGNGAFDESNIVERADYPVHYEGLSVFSTSPTGDYGSNVIAPESELLALLPATLHPALTAVRRSLQRRLAALLLGHYVGPVGVDMMIVRRPIDNLKNDKSPIPPADALALHPCVEVNLRRTMGLVAIARAKELPH